MNVLKQLAFVTAFFAGCQAAHAQSMDSMLTAQYLGNVLASEEFCNLQYDQAGIQAYIDKNIKESDMSFPSNLQMFQSAGRRQLDDLTESGKTAHCTQITRLAKKYGFVAK